jgi:hypothetical protein
MAQLSVVDTTPDNWDRGPDQRRAQRLAQLYHRRDRVFDKARHLVGSRPPRRRDLVLIRLEKLAALHAQYDALAHRILALELL